MPIAVDVSLRVNIAGAGVLDQSGPETVAAIDDISIDLAPGTTDQAVAIQPGPASAIVH